MKKYVYCKRKLINKESINYFTPGSRYKIYIENYKTFVETNVGPVTWSIDNIQILREWYEIKIIHEFNSLLEDV